VSDPAPVSPCIAVCVLDPGTGYCRGCFRTLPEIVQWPKLDADGKRRVIALLAGRKAAAGHGEAR
jgi:predicted Fe-S protein YdhL (DUF1289 family)